VTTVQDMIHINTASLTELYHYNRYSSSVNCSSWNNFFWQTIP